MTSSLDIKIANAQRRAAEEKAQAGLPGSRPTPPMDANDRKMIVGDIAKALEAKRAAGTVPLATLNAIVRSLEAHRAKTAPAQDAAIKALDDSIEEARERFCQRAFGWSAATQALMWEFTRVEPPTAGSLAASCLPAKLTRRDAPVSLTVLSDIGPQLWLDRANGAATPEPLPTPEQQAAFFGVSDRVDCVGAQYGRAPLICRQYKRSS